MYRNLDDDEWKEYIEGRHSVDPSRFLTKILNKPLLLIHGMDDKVIRSYHTESFYNKLKENGAKQVEFIIKEGVGHGKDLRTSTWNKWLKWMTDLFS